MENYHGTLSTLRCQRWEIGGFSSPRLIWLYHRYLKRDFHQGIMRQYTWWLTPETLVKYHWLVVTGTMEFHDFPFSWEWKIRPQLTNSLHDFSEG